jgi:hypothetical protein
MRRRIGRRAYLRDSSVEFLRFENLDPRPASCVACRGSYVTFGRWDEKLCWETSRCLSARAELDVFVTNHEQPGPRTGIEVQLGFYGPRHRHAAD